MNSITANFRRVDNSSMACLISDANAEIETRLSAKVTKTLSLPSKRDIQQSTIYRSWVKLRIRDIFDCLTTSPDYADQNIYFFRDHPIRWICIVGVITSVEEKDKMNTYTVDDGSGRSISVISTDLDESISLIKCYNLHATIRVKGTLQIHYKCPQLRASAMKPVLTLQSQMMFWQQTRRLRNDVLTKPWRALELHSTGKPTSVRRRAYDESRRKDLPLLSAGPSLKHAERSLEYLENRIKESPLSRDRQQKKIGQMSVSNISQATYQNAGKRSFNNISTTKSSHSLKATILDYLNANGKTVFTLSDLRTVPAILEQATFEPSYDLRTGHPLNNFQTLIYNLGILVNDGSVICLSRTDYAYEVVGSWNIGDVVNDVCEQARLQLDPKLKLQSVMRRIKEQGPAWSTITSTVIIRIVDEIVRKEGSWRCQRPGLWILQK